jgi:hypothetical protein
LCPLFRSIPSYYIPGGGVSGFLSPSDPMLYGLDYYVGASFFGYSKKYVDLGLAVVQYKSEGAIEEYAKGGNLDEGRLYNDISKGNYSPIAKIWSNLNWNFLNSISMPAPRLYGLYLAWKYAAAYKDLPHHETVTE